MFVTSLYSERIFVNIARGGNDITIFFYIFMKLVAKKDKFDHIQTVSSFRKQAYQTQKLFLSFWFRLGI